MWRSVTRTTGLPRPAKPAPQTAYTHDAGLATALGIELRPRGSEMGACHACRAGFASRGTPLARATERDKLAPPPDPRRSLGSA